MTSTSDLNTYIQQLQQQLVATQQQLQQLQIDTQNEFKQFSLNNNNNSTNNNKMLKPVKPPTYHGDRRTNAEIWLLELENYFAITGVTDGTQRVAFAVSQFRDAAVIWWKHLKQQPDTDTELVNDWDKFKRQLLRNYAPVEAAETARTALHRLKQTHTVAAYCDVFLRYMNNVEDMAVADQLFLFKQGLQNHISKEVSLQHPKNLHEAMSFAQRAEIESRSYRTDPRRANFRPSHRHNYNRFSSGSGHGNAGNAPMELGNINFGTNGSAAAHGYNNYAGYYDNNGYNDYGNEDNNQPPEHMVNAIGSNPSYNSGMNRYPPRNNNFRVPGLTREQIETYKRTNACFKCGQTGHYKSSCPKK